MLPTENKKGELKRVKMCDDIINTDPPPEIEVSANVLEFNANGTVATENYYNLLPTNQNIIIGNLKHLTDMLFGKLIMATDLTLIELNLFNDKVWLSTTSIELMSAIIWNNSKLKLETSVLSPKVGNVIFCQNNTKPMNNEFYELLPNQKCWIIPFNIRNMHWVLAFVNFELGIFGYLDPLSNCRLDILKYKDKFEQFYKHIYPNSKELKIHKFDYEKQQDSYNCGIYVLLYIECILNKKQLIISTN